MALRRDGKKNTEFQKHSAIPRVALEGHRKKDTAWLDYSLMAGMALRQASKKIHHYMPSKPWQALTLRKASKKRYSITRPRSRGKHWLWEKLAKPYNILSHGKHWLWDKLAKRYSKAWPLCGTGYAYEKRYNRAQSFCICYSGYGFDTWSQNHTALHGCSTTTRAVLRPEGDKTQHGTAILWYRV